LLDESRVVPEASPDEWSDVLAYDDAKRPLREDQKLREGLVSKASDRAIVSRAKKATALAKAEHRGERPSVAEARELERSASGAPVRPKRSGRVEVPADDPDSLAHRRDAFEKEHLERMHRIFEEASSE
jgi:hypothetical protein